MIKDVARAKKPKRTPVVLTKKAVKELPANLEDPIWLITSMMYRAGLRLMESLRHSFATNHLKKDYDIRIVQEPLGHKDVKTAMIYTLVLNSGGRGVLSPADELWKGLLSGFSIKSLNKFRTPDTTTKRIVHQVKNNIRLGKEIQFLRSRNHSKLHNNFAELNDRKKQIIQ